MPKTISIFFLLLVGSWILEFLLGTQIVAWYWGTDWFVDGAAGQASIAENVVRFGHSASTRITGTWTATGIVTFFVMVFVALHLVYAVCFGLFGPFVMRRCLGARHPSHREQEQFQKVYQVLIRPVAGMPPVCPSRFLIADGPGLQMRYIGYALVIDRELLWHRHFPSLLAAQLGHANSEDRLARRLYAMLPALPTIAGMTAGFPFGVAHILLFPLWAWYWRERIYSADAFAVHLDQGRQLIRALDEIYLKLDLSTRGGRWFRPIPYVEQRIDRIERELAEQEARGGRAPRII